MAVILKLIEKMTSNLISKAKIASRMILWTQNWVIESKKFKIIVHYDP